MRDRIERRKWLKLSPLMCHAKDCYAKDFTEYDHPLMYLLREVQAIKEVQAIEEDEEEVEEVEEFTRETEEAIERLMGRSLTSEEWFHCMFANRMMPSIPFLRYLILNNRIELNQVYPENILIRLATMDSEYSRELDVFLIEEMGMDIHTCCAWSGNTILVCMLRHPILDRSRIQYYLENGADPLQEGRNGLSAWMYAQTHPFPSDLIKLLEQYV